MIICFFLQIIIYYSDIAAGRLYPRIAQKLVQLYHSALNITAALKVRHRKMSGIKELMRKVKKEMAKGIGSEQKTESASDTAFYLFASFKQQHGSIIIISALMLPLMLACLGFAYDFGNLYIHKTRLQNVADAAALAGGRAYLESQKNTDVRFRDKTDDMPDTEDGLYSGAWKQKTYQPGLGPDQIDSWEGRHTSADRAADINICNNIVNLGTVVKTDEYSHYALKSEGRNYRVFYRIGLYEEVPLHFLSLVLNKKEQRVRAGAVVLIDDGNGFSIGKTLFDNLFTVKNGINLAPGVAVDTGGTTIQATFDGSIVVANEDSENEDIYSWKWAKANKGDYFYTEAEKDYNTGMVYDKDGNKVHVASQEHSISDMNAIPNTGGRAVLDNSIGIDSSVSGFLNKLTEPHADLKKNCDVELLSKTIKISELDTYKSKDTYLKNQQHYTISKTENDVTYVTDYYHKVTGKYDGDNTPVTRYISCVPRGDRYKLSSGEASVEEISRDEDYEYSPGKAYVLYDRPDEKDYYYCFYTEGKIFKNSITQYELKPKDFAFTYVLDEENNKIFCVKNKEVTSQPFFDFYRKKLNPGTNQYIYWQINNRKDNRKEYYLDDSQTVSNDTGIHCTYRDKYDSNKLKTFTVPRIKKENLDFSNAIRVNDNQINHSSIYHLEQDGWEKENYEYRIEVDNLPGEEYQPLYMIVTGTKGRPIKINVTNSNVRPLIFCNLTTNEISEFTIDDDAVFKGAIYSPYAKVVNKVPAATGTTGRKFIGNIIAKELSIEDSGTTWTHQNFLENDGDVNTITDDEAKEQEKRKQRAIKFALKELGITADEWNDPSWFNNHPEKQEQIQKAWNAARQKLWSGVDSSGENLNDEALTGVLSEGESVNDYIGLDMPDWPWTNGGATDTHHYDNNEDTGEKLRLINFRTEYTTEPYYNPFNNLKLSDDE